MSRLQKLLERVREELRKAPGTPVPELARKFTVPEGTILETLRDEGVFKARRGTEHAILEELRSWGVARLRVRNDWAQAEVPCDLKDLELRENDLILTRSEAEVRVNYARVEAIYFVERAERPSVKFFNRRGRSIFEVILSPDSPSVARFKSAEKAYCA